MRTCKSCKYSEPIGGGLACMGQKGMPFVRPTDSCERWKTSKQTNADRIRAMTDDELATIIFCGNPCVEQSFKTETELLDWLKQEATDES